MKARVAILILDKIGFLKLFIFIIIVLGVHCDKINFILRQDFTI
jgi:hypothetical protein